MRHSRRRRGTNHTAVPTTRAVPRYHGKPVASVNQLPRGSFRFSTAGRAGAPITSSNVDAAAMVGA